MDVFALIEALIPTIVTTLGLTALLKGWVAAGYKRAREGVERAPKWVTRALALVIAVATAVQTGNEAMLPEITSGAVSAFFAWGLAWVQSWVGSKAGPATPND